MSSADARVRAQLGAHVLHSRYDSREITKAARQAFLDRLDREVDPEGKLDPAERARRAKHARSAHFRRLALKSAQARRRRSQ